MIDNFRDATNFSYKSLLTNRQLRSFCKHFANYLSTDIKLSKTQLSKIIQPGWFLSKLFGLLSKSGLILIKM